MVPDPQLETLLGRIGRGDVTALDAFYEATVDPLYGVALRILGSRADADDTIQEVFVTIWEKADGFRADAGSAMAWAVTITRHRALDRIRARQRDTTRARTLHGMAGRNGDAAADVGTGRNGEVRSKLNAVLARLPAAERAAIEMAFFEGKNHGEIARALGCPAGTIKARIRRGMAKLRGPLIQLRAELLDA